MSLPTNDALTAFSDDVPWMEIERQRRQFNRLLDTLQEGDDTLPLDRISEAVGAPVSLYNAETSDGGNVILSEFGDRKVILGSAVSKRYRAGHSLKESIVPYNLNPSVNHTNVAETEDSVTRMRVIGAEIELGVLHEDGASPTEVEVQGFMNAYYNNALRIGIYPKLDREACQYQVEAHIAPSVGYVKTRSALNGILTALAAASRDTNLITAVFSCYPTESDFKMTDHPKVQTAVDLMLEVNGLFPEYARRLAEAQARYHVDPATCHHVNMFRNQGCHIHIDLAGRSEALGLLTFYTVLKSATAVANSAVLKGCPFVNGTCDPELLDAREYVRSTTVTGRYLQLPISPHLMPDGLDQYAHLLLSERANATGRAMMFNDDLGLPISVMHNPIGRIRPDLGTAKRVCTVESTGMPTNVSAARMAAVITDFEFTHSVMESYFRKYGCDLEPMQNDKDMWDIVGPLPIDTFQAQQDQSDRLGTDMTLTTASGREMRLSEFYAMKRRFMHQSLDEVDEVTPRDIDDVYTSLERMLEPLSGHEAKTIHQYINDPKLRSTGNWGRILRDSFIEAGGVPGEHCPDAVLTVVKQTHAAMHQRYLQT